MMSVWLVAKSSPAGDEPALTRIGRPWTGFGSMNAPSVRYHRPENSSSSSARQSCFMTVVNSSARA